MQSPRPRKILTKICYFEAFSSDLEVEAESCLKLGLKKSVGLKLGLKMGLGLNLGMG